MSTTKAPLEDKPGFKELAQTKGSPYSVIEKEEIMNRIDEIELDMIEKENAS